MWSVVGLISMIALASIGFVKGDVYGIPDINDDRGYYVVVEDSTTYNKVYKYFKYPIKPDTGYLLFEVKTEGSAFITLSAEANDQIVQYEIAISGYKALIRRCIGSCTKAIEVHDFVLLSGTEFRFFCICYDNGYIRLGQTCRQESGLAYWTDDSPLSIKYFGYATEISESWKTGMWKFYIVDKIAPDIKCPHDIVVATDLNQDGAVVTWDAPVVTDNSDQAVAVVCEPASGSVFPLDVVTTVICTATDSAGNSATCDFTVTVQDEEDPTINCPVDFYEVTDPGQPGAVVTWEVTAQDNSGIQPTIVCDAGGLQSGDQFPIGVTTVTCTATDEAGNQVSCFFTINVNDEEDPTINCPVDFYEVTDPGQPGAVVTWEVTAQDNSGIQPTIVCDAGGLQSGDQFPIGVTTVTCTATDEAGNQATCSFTINVDDEEDPTINCPVDFYEVTDPGQPGAVVTWEVTAQDNSGIQPTIVCDAGGLQSGDQFPIGVTTVTCTATDEAGNELSCSFTINVNDEEDPTINCPIDFFKVTDPGQPGAVVTWEVTAQDNSGIQPTIVCDAGGLQSGDQFPIGVTMVTCTATDEAGNQATCSFTINVDDEEDPTINCPVDFYEVTDPGQPGAVVTWEVTAQDNSGIQPTIVCDAGGLQSGDQFPIGVTTVTCTATDEAGNELSCSFTINVNDEEDPTINCPVDFFKVTDPGQPGAVVTWEVTAQDNSGIQPTIVCDAGGLQSGDQFPIGVTTVTCTATDEAGNQVSCFFTINVNDDEDPTINCPVDFYEVTDPGQPGAVVTWEVTAQDNSGIQPTIVCDAGGLQSGDQFPIGVTTVTCTATDEAGNELSCSFTINVNDEEDPTINCPVDFYEVTDPGQPGAVVTWEVTAQDNSGIQPTIVCDAGGLQSGDQFPIGVTTVTCTATDEAGNELSCSFTINVNDEEDPTVNCPVDFYEVTDPGQPGAVVTWEVTAQDNSGIQPTIVCDAGGLQSGDQFPIGVTTVTCTATDEAGNDLSCSFTINVNDEEDPTINCPVDFFKVTDPGQPGAVVTWEVTAQDNSGIQPTIVCDAGGLQSGDQFPIGVTTVTCTATDEAGNQATCSFTINVNDEEDPTINCPVDFYEVTDPGQPGAVVTWEVTAQDNSGIQPTIVCDAGGLQSGDQFPIGVTTVTCTATDEAGNELSCSFTINVNDEEDPSINCPVDFFKVTDPGQPGAVVTWEVTAQDNSGIQPTIVCDAGGLQSGDQFPIGVTTVTCTATDEAGNELSCSFTINVNDEEDPTINCPVDFYEVTDPGQPGAVVTWEVTAQDNSGIQPTIVCDAGGLQSGDQFPIGVTTVTCTATDEAGNQATCSFTINVNDEEDPTINCPVDFFEVTDPGQPGAVVTWEVTAQDNSGIQPTIVCDAGGLQSGDQFPIGVTTVTCTATDEAGNEVSCSFTINVNDEEDPTINCPVDFFKVTDPGQPGAVVTWEVTAQDNSGIQPIIVCDAGGLQSGDQFPIGVTTVTCTATDEAGNELSCSFTINVNDEEDPSINCPVDFYEVTDPGQPGAVVTWEVTAQDNSGIQPTIVCDAGGLQSGDQFPIGVTTVTCTATDEAGNQASCSFTITVNDDEKPSISCSEDVVVKEDDCLNTAVVTYTVTATDNSGLTPTVSCYPASGYAFPLGTTTVTCVATDGNGNENHCEFTVTVEDKDPCLNNQCVNGGICVPDPVDCYKYTCECTPYYKGIYCERLFLVQLDVQEVTVEVPSDALITDGGIQDVTLDIDFIPTPDSADVVNAAGTDRYRIQVFLATDSDGSNPTPPTDADLTPTQMQQDITDLILNTFDDVAVTLDLSQVSCFEGQYQYICIDLGPSQAALDNELWDQAPPAIRIGCAQITCKSSVEINIDLIRVDSPSTLILCDEEINQVSITLTATPTTDSSAPVNGCDGGDRYSVTAILATDAQGSDSFPIPAGVLTPAVQAMDLVDNQQALFTNIVFEVDLTGVDCNQAGYSYLCVTLDSSDACGTSWCQSPEAVDTACTPIFCSSNVELNVDSVVVTLPPDAIISDGVLQDLTFDLDFIPAPGSAAPVNSAGLDRYEVKGYLSTDASGLVKVAAEVVTLTPAQDSMDVTDGVASTFNDLSVTLDLTGVSCAGGIYTHFCAELEPSLEASKVWKQSDNAVTIGCFPICCGESVDINVDVLTIDWPTSLIIHDGGIANIFLCIFLSTTSAADVINAIPTGVDRYEITTWLAQDAAGNGALATTQGRILEKFQVQEIANGQQFMMAEVDVEFDLTYIDCHETPIWDVCINIQPAPPARCYWNQLPTAVNQICTPIYCVPNVELNVNVLDIASPHYIVDGGATTVTFDLKFTPTTGSSPPVNWAGDDRYLVMVYLAQNLHGDYPTAFAEAILTATQKKLDIADNIQSIFASLTVSLDLTGVDCSTAKYKYICANLLPSTAAQKKWAQSSDAVITACASVPCVACHDEYQTYGDGAWHFIFGHLQTSHITFAVKASGYAHVALSAENKQVPLMYEIIFGGYDNSMVLLRRQAGGEFVASAALHGALSPYEYRTFWIWWHHATIIVGVGGSHEPILTYTDPDQLWIKYFGFASSYQAIGYWHFCNVEYGGLPPHITYPPYYDCDLYAPAHTYGSDPYQYIWNVGLLQSHTVHFQVYAYTNVYIALSAENHNLPDMYEIIIGSSHGVGVSIARCAGCDPVAYAAHPWVLNYYSYTNIYVGVSPDGTITISYSSAQHILLSWQDPNPLPVSYCGYCTGGQHNYGLWKFCGLDSLLP
ncbi:uncharacterized protein LOC119741056 isoform X5 [Patiria miniata]|uniref:Hyalin n=1 Tax=Patiria miniata TaxID=46514 RepID=A0A914B8T9_PATMI|nr:uncharacterized protein LOC119741056 isoform X5 [Patiria miniata]